MHSDSTETPLSGVVWGVIFAAPFWAVVIWLLAH
jgi:hypothetical protein